jgi:hypothetical protein
MKQVADSGQLASMAGMVIPSIKAANKVVMEPEVRKTAKRVKVRLGPVTLVGNGVNAPNYLPRSDVANSKINSNRNPLLSSLQGVSSHSIRMDNPLSTY